MGKRLGRVLQWTLPLVLESRAAVVDWVEEQVLSASISWKTERQKGGLQTLNPECMSLSAVTGRSRYLRPANILGVAC